MRNKFETHRQATARCGRGTDLLSMFLLLIYILAEIIFLGIIVLFFMHPEFNDETVKEMFEWRTTVGQSSFWTDPSLQISLSTEACSP